MANQTVELCIYWQTEINGMRFDKNSKLIFELTGSEDLTYLMVKDEYEKKLSYNLLEDIVVRYAQLIRDGGYLNNTPANRRIDEWSFLLTTIAAQKRSLIIGKKASYLVDLLPLTPSEVGRMNHRFATELGPEYQYGRLENLNGYAVTR